MKVKVGRAKIAALLLAVALIAVLAPACGCGGKKTATENTNTTTAPQGTAPSTSTGTSRSEAALAQAKAEGKPVLIKFGSGQCLPCVQIEENIVKVKPEYEGKVAFIIVDVYDPSENNLTTQYEIQTIPTTYFLGRDGSVVNRVVGLMEPDQLKQQLDTLL